MQLPHVAEVFERFVRFDGPVILSHLLEYFAFTLEHCEQEQLAFALNKSGPVESQHEVLEHVNQHVEGLFLDLGIEQLILVIQV